MGLLKRLLLRVHATPGERVVFEGPRPKGYYQTLGITATDESDVTRIVQEFVAQDTGGTVLEIDDLVVADLNGIHSEIGRLSGDPGRIGVWYLSGRAFYANDDECR